ncbi:MAG TPA: hypothetical protein VFV28_08785, partial [Limnobacter sp.]|nr:hypothetical protein [Limnobacter sp.]
SLVQARNSSLEVNRTPDALLLRCHVGLVELAYLDALNGQSTTPEVAGELVDNLLGASFHELGLPTPLCVPDLVKSLVRAKMCEVSGQHQRRLLHENLLSLNATAIGPALCFSLPEWQEFLSEEGLLD